MAERGIGMTASCGDSTFVVDLDGCLLRTDLLYEGVLRLVRSNPLWLLVLPLWLLRGKAYLKERIAAASMLDVAGMPYNVDVLALVDRVKADGGRVILATASHHSLAERVARHLGRFDDVLATRSANLAGTRKLQAIKEAVKGGDFSYVGNALADLPIWQQSKQIYVVEPTIGVEAALRRMNRTPSAVFRREKPYLRSMLKAVRLHQWLKNILVFVPLLAAHRLDDPSAWGAAIIMFFAYGLVASSIYVINDLLDLDDDRAHPRKRNRPFASGSVPIFHGLLLAPVLLVAGIALAISINTHAGALLLGYFAASTAYTFLLKRFVVMDVLTLAGLYTLRILAGAAATQIQPSFWLLAFSMFFFLSLASMKRAAELQSLSAVGRDASSGRDYGVRDLPAIRALGVSSGYMSVLVFALYINAPEVASNYATPQALWVVCIVLLYWLGRLWVKTDRGEMHDDPVVYAITDWNSRVLGVGCVVVLALASVAWL